MNASNLRETLACQGGPLNRLRVSVPQGLRWFTLENHSIQDTSLPPSEDAVIHLESIEQIVDFSTQMELGESQATADLPAYVRKQFVSGEKGLINVLVFQQR